MPCEARKTTFIVFSLNHAFPRQFDFLNILFLMQDLDRQSSVLSLMLNIERGAQNYSLSEFNAISGLNSPPLPPQKKY